MSFINMYTYNVRGLGNAKKRCEVFHFLNIKNCDVVFLQETHSAKKYESKKEVGVGR